RGWPRSSQELHRLLGARRRAPGRPVDETAEGAPLRRRGCAAPDARPELVAPLGGLGLEAVGGPLEEPEVEVVLAAGRRLLDLVQRLLVPEVPVAGRHRALLDDVVDVAQDAVGRHLALAQLDQGFDLAR